MSRQELVKMIPEFNLIKDEDLRGKAVTVFEEAMEEGGWTVTDLEDIPFTLLLEGCDISLIAHTRAIAKISNYAADLFEELYPGRLKLNRDYLIAGAILHDVGKLVEYRKEGGKVIKSQNGILHRHPFTGAAIAREAGLPSE
ncbi:MAG: HDIG domain-containing protein, partial [Chloroflexi bacterium]|nr:HDIG domain-containing protein [Chloroflexota bacterium]